MTVEATCTAGIMCEITKHAAFLYNNPHIGLPVLIIIILAAIGLSTVYKHYREHGAQETAKKGWGIFLESGYVAYSVLKHLVSKAAWGAMVAAVVTLLGGVPHILHAAHASSASTGHAAAAQHARPAGRDHVHTADREQAPIAPASAQDQPVGLGNPVEATAHFVDRFPDRMIEMRLADASIIIHPGDKRSDTRPS